MPNNTTVVAACSAFDLLDRDPVLSRLDKASSFALALGILSSKAIAAGKFSVFLLLHGLPKGLLLPNHGGQNLSSLVLFKGSPSRRPPGPAASPSRRSQGWRSPGPAPHPGRCRSPRHSPSPCARHCLSSFCLLPAR